MLLTNQANNGDTEMIENIFLLALAIAALAGAFTLGFIGQLIYIRLTEGKASARQFIRDEF